MPLDDNKRFSVENYRDKLYQEVMKRKIEIKTAFDASPAPEELDSMLKKVGI